MNATDPEKLIIREFQLSKQFSKVKSVPFSSVVKVSCGFKVIPLNVKNSYDKSLLRLIQKNLKDYLATAAGTENAFGGKRVNDTGKKLEMQISHELNKHPLKATQLRGQGYPDIEISYKRKKTYLEVKTTSIKSKSDFRSFYYTNGKKLNADAHHLLLTIFVTSAGRRWQIKEMTLSDLSKLNVKLKAEFNASRNDLEKCVTLFAIN